MRNFKKVLTALIVIAAILTLAVTTITAKTLTPVLSKDKDGLKAELTVTDMTLALKLTNENAVNVSNIVVNVTLPEGFELASGNLSEAVTIAIGENKELSFIVNETEPETTPETTPETDPETKPVEQSGCKGTVVSAVSVIVMIGVALILIKKNRKATLSCLMLGAMLLGGFAFAVPTEAATTERSIELLGVVTYEGTEYSVGVSVCYDHTFTETDLPQTTGMKRFEISYYFGPQGEHMYDEYYIKTIAEGGFTSIPLENNSAEANKKALELLRKYGLTCSALMDWRIINAVGHDNYASPDTPQEEIDRIVQEVVADYADYMDVIKGWWIKDEPNAAKFEILGKIVSAFRRYSPDTNTMINLFPTYAGNTLLGSSSYQAHLDEFVSQVNPYYLSMDHYHFMKNGNHTDSFFMNLELIRKKALESGICYMNIFQLTATMQPLAPDLTYDQLEWEVNLAMTYGIKRMSYYTFYLGPDWIAAGDTNGCMDYTGKIYPHYYDVQKIHKWLYPLGTHLFDKTSVAVFHTLQNKYQTLQKGCSEYVGYGDLGEVDGKHFVIGFFDDGSFMISNKYYRDISTGYILSELSKIDPKEGTLYYLDMKTGEVKDAISDGIVEIDENGKYVNKSQLPGYTMLTTVSETNPFEFIDVKDGLEYFDTATATWRDAEADGVVTRNENGNLVKDFTASEGVLFRVVD